MRHVEVTVKHTGYTNDEAGDGTLLLHEHNDGLSAWREFTADAIVEVKDVENPLPSWWPLQQGDMLIDHSLPQRGDAGVVRNSGSVSWASGKISYNGLGLLERAARDGNLELVRRAGNL